MYKLSISLFFATILFVSCKNNDDSSSMEQELNPDNFYALTVGNIWTYEYFRRLQDDFESSGVVSTVEIVDEEVIGASSYFVFQITTVGNDTQSPVYPENGMAIEKRRDSLGYLINDNGRIYFSSNNEADYFIGSYNWGEVFGKLNNEPTLISVPAGNFTCLNNELYGVLPDGNIAPGRTHYFFAEEIGEINYYISSVGNPIHTFERRLMSYDLVND